MEWMVLCVVVALSIHPVCCDHMCVGMRCSYTTTSRGTNIPLITGGEVLNRMRDFPWLVALLLIVVEISHSYRHILLP